MKMSSTSPNRLKRILSIQITLRVSSSMTGAIKELMICFFIQFPTHLPFQIDGAGEIPRTSSSSGFTNVLSQAPSGKLGELIIYKSGKVKLKIGEVLYDVSKGMPSSFFEELVYLDPGKKEFVPLGSIEKRMVVAPDIRNLL